MASSNDTGQLDQIRAAARKRGYSDAEIEQKLMDAGLIDKPSLDFGRIAGLAARSGIQAMGNLQDLNPFSAPTRIADQIAGIPSQGPLGPAVANQLGLPQPSTPMERMGVAGGEGLVTSAAMGGGPGLMALGAASGLAGQGAQEQGMSPMGQMAASAAVGLGLPVAGMVLSGGIRAALAGSAARREAARQATALIQAGDPQAAVTLGQVAEGGAARTIEGGLRNIPGATSVFARTLDKQADEMGARVEKIAATAGPPANKEVVGAAVKRGIEYGFIPNFKAKTEELYQKVYSLVPQGSPVTPTAVTRLIAKQNDMLGMARELSDDISSPKFASILNHIDEAVSSSPNGTIPFAVMKELRSRLGAILSGDELIADINRRDVKILYGALTEDMGAAIQKAGGTPATQAWNRANTFYQKGADRIERILEPLVSKRTPEQAFAALMSGTKEGATALRATLRSLPAAEAGLVRANVLRQLGRMDDDTFNPELFLRKLNALAPTARTALFEADPQVGTNLSALASMAESRKQAGKVMFNASGTAPNVAFFAILNGLSRLTVSGAGALVGQQIGGGPGAALGAMAGPALTAVGANQLAERVFTSPRMIHWLVRQTKIPFGAMSQELAILAKESRKWGPSDQQIAQDLTGALAHMDWRSILMGGAVADATAIKR